MKKRLSLLAVLVCMALLCGCSFSANITNIQEKAESEMESAEAVSQMLSALTEGDLDTAKALVHPAVSGELDTTLTQMCDFLAGRRAASLEFVNCNVTSSAGTSGATRQEKAAYTVTLEDGTVFHVSAYYVIDLLGEGFSSYQIVLGVV